MLYGAIKDADGRVILRGGKAGGITLLDFRQYYKAAII